MLSELAGQQQTDGGLDLAARDRRSLVVLRESGRFASNALENIIDERIHDRHSLAGDTSVWMYLLQNLVDVDSVTLPSASAVLLVTSTNRLRLRHRLLRALRCCLWSHISNTQTEEQIKRTAFIRNQASPECALRSRGRAENKKRFYMLIM